MSSKYIYEETNDSFSYTPEGIARLSMLIKASLSARKWTARELARNSGITSPTASKYLRGSVKKPQESVMKAIAPFIYKPISFTKTGVEIDTDSVLHSWKELALIATNKYLQEYVDCQPCENRALEILRQLIFQQLEIDNINLVRFTEKSSTNLQEIRQILNCKFGDDFDYTMMLLAIHLYNPQHGRNFSGYEELAYYCGITPLNSIPDLDMNLEPDMEHDLFDNNPSSSIPVK